MIYSIIETCMNGDRVLIDTDAPESKMNYICDLYKAGVIDDIITELIKSGYRFDIIACTLEMSKTEYDDIAGSITVDRKFYT